MGGDGREWGEGHAGRGGGDGRKWGEGNTGGGGRLAGCSHVERATRGGGGKEVAARGKARARADLILRVWGPTLSRLLRGFEDRGGHGSGRDGAARREGIWQGLGGTGRGRARGDVTAKDGESYVRKGGKWYV